MHQTAAKALVRQYFYRQFLPAHLSPELIRSSRYLVLLGDNTEEEALLAELGIPGARVYSVERNQQVYVQQAARSRRKILGSALYFGELSEFVTHYLEANQRFSVLNLDICGSYKRNIDPVMTPILQFARRNPRTIIATYSNAGRDRPQLLEGLKSLAICSWYAPVHTAAVVNQLYSRYRSAELSESVSFNMVLRHLFWLRSHLEHILRGYVAHRSRAVFRAERLLVTLNEAWSQTVADFHRPMTYGDTIEAISAHQPRLSSARLLDLQLGSVTAATYESLNHMYHIGWFTIYQPGHAQSPSDWLSDSLRALVAEPLRFTDQAASELRTYPSTELQIPSELIIWTRQGRIDGGRTFVLPTPRPAAIEPEHPAVSSASNGTGTLTQVKRLSTGQIASIRRAARARPTATTLEIMEQLQLERFPRTSVTAYVAMARRAKRPQRAS